MKELREKQRAAGSCGFQRTATFEHREALKNEWDLSGYQRGKEVFPDEAEQGPSLSQGLIWYRGRMGHKDPGKEEPPA